MNLEDYRVAFTATSLILMLVAASPILSVIISFPASGERFSEFWILGPAHTAENYPFNITINEKKQVYIGLSNHMGYSIYYLVYVKLRNQTQSAPNSTTSTPSPLAPLHEFHVVVADGETWEKPLTFSILEASRLGESLLVTRISINDAALGIYSLSNWNPEKTEFYHQLFFELWTYDDAVSSFRYHNRFVGIGLNLTI